MGSEPACDVRHESVAFIELLTDDADGMYQLLSAAPGVAQYRRAYVRAQFAAIEGAIAVLRRHGLNMRHALGTGEAVLLEEKAYRISDKGKVKDSLVYVKFEQNVRFVFQVVAKAYSLEFELKKDGTEWRALLAGVEIRNRLTHPKTIASMSVNDLEVETVRGAGQWFMKEALLLLNLVLECEERQREERFRKASFPDFLGLYNPTRGLDLGVLLPTDERLQQEAEMRALDDLMTQTVDRAEGELDDTEAAPDD